MSREAAETIEYKGHTIEIKYDECGESPREMYDNICIFHIAHRRYSFGDDNYNDYESIKEAEKEALRNKDMVLPLYMYDHGGITISLTPFSCPWDSGQVGFVQIPRYTMIREFTGDGGKNFSPRLKRRALEIAKNEVKELDSYLRGEVYGYVIDEDEDGDSCWGYIGDIKYCIEEAKAVVNNIVNNESKCLA